MQIEDTPWDKKLSILSILKILFYIKLYSLLILTKNIKKVKNNFKAPQKSEIVIFPGCILPCKQISTIQHFTPHIPTSWTVHEIKAIAANWCLPEHPLASV